MTPKKGDSKEHPLRIRQVASGLDRLRPTYSCATPSEVVLNYSSGLRVPIGRVKGRADSAAAGSFVGEIRDARRDMTERHVQISLEMKRRALEKRAVCVGESPL
jgi:hypothetical protein